MAKFWILGIVAAAIAVGCSGQDVGDANKQLEPGQATAPGAPATPGGGAGAPTQGGPALQGTATPQ